VLVLAAKPNDANDEIIVRIDGQVVLVVRLIEIAHMNKARLGFQADSSVEINRASIDRERYPGGSSKATTGAAAYERDPMLPK